jgi:tetratricopeptide (TPR) repeat protein
LVFRWALSGLALWLLIAFLLRFPNEYWTEKARLALGRHDYSASIAAAEQALTFDDRNPELFLHLGGAWRGTAITADDYEIRLRSFEASVEAYQRGLSLFPQDVHMLIRLGQSLAVLGRFKEAEEAFRAAVEHDKNFAPAHAYYARHLALVGRDEEAEAQFKKATSLENSTPIHAIVRGTSLDAGAIDPS